MDINRNNYEIHLIDYLDGNLDEVSKSAVEQFLAENKDIAREFEGLIDIKLYPETNDKKDFSAIKRSEKDLLPDNYPDLDEFVVAAYEGDLTEKEEKHFERLIRISPKAEKEYSYIEKTRLEPDLSVHYPKKAQLKRVSLFYWKRVIWYAASVAAVAMLFLLINIGNKSVVPGDDQVVEIPIDEKRLAQNPDRKIIGDAIKKMTIPEVDRQEVPGVETTVVDTRAAFPISEERVMKKEYADFKMVANNVNIPEFEFEKINSSGFQFPDKENLLANVGNDETGLKGMFVRKFKKKVLQVEGPDESKLSLWDFAEASIEGAGRFIGRNVDFSRKYDEEGNVIAFAYESNMISLNRSIRK